MNSYISNPITCTDIVSDPKYLIEIERNKPRPRLRQENQWIRDRQEQGSVGILFKLQELQTKQDNMRKLKEGIQSLCRSRLHPACNCGQHFLPRGQRPSKPTSRPHKSSTPPTTRSSSSSSSSSSSNSSSSSGAKSKSKPPTASGSSSPARFLKAHQKTGPPLHNTDYPPIPRVNLKDPNTVRLSVPRAASAKSLQLQRRNIDYIRANAYTLQCEEAKPDRRRLEKQKTLDMSSYKFGEVPRYIQMAKKGQEQTARPSSTPPVSERRLTAVEKDVILKNLKLERDTLYGQLNRLPISMDTLRLQRQQRSLESELARLDRAIELYSAPIVLVTC